MPTLLPELSAHQEQHSQELTVRPPKRTTAVEDADREVVEARSIAVVAAVVPMELLVKEARMPSTAPRESTRDALAADGKLIAMTYDYLTCSCPNSIFLETQWTWRTVKGRTRRTRIRKRRPGGPRGREGPYQCRTRHRGGSWSRGCCWTHRRGWAWARYASTRPSLHVILDTHH